MKQDLTIVLLRYVKYCFRSINDTINQNYRDNDTKRYFYNGQPRSHFAFCCCHSNRSNRYACLLHRLALRRLPLRRGAIQVFAFIAPSSEDGRLPVICKSRNFECALRLCICDHAHVRNYTLHRYVICGM